MGGGRERRPERDAGVPELRVRRADGGGGKRNNRKRDEVADLLLPILLASVVEERTVEMSEDRALANENPCPKCGGPSDHASGYVYRKANLMNNPPAQQEPVTFRVCQNPDCRHSFGLGVVAERHPRLYQAEKEERDGS